MKITIAASIRLLFILTLVAISVVGQTGLIAQGRGGLSCGGRDTPIENLAKGASRDSGGAHAPSRVGFGALAETSLENAYPGDHR